MSYAEQIAEASFPGSNDCAAIEYADAMAVAQKADAEVERLRADVAVLSRALAETAGEEPERPAGPGGIPKRTFRSRDPYTDLHGWLAQRITYASFVQGKMPDANRRYLAKAWGRDLKLALSSLNREASA